VGDFFNRRTKFKEEVMGKRDFKSALLLFALIAVICLVMSAPAHAAKIEFGITEDKIKIGDGSAGYVTYGPGQSIAVSGQELHVAYPTDNSYGEVEIRYASSMDGGATWEKSELIARDTNFYETGASIAVANDIVHVVWANNSTQTIYHSRSVSGGQWSTPAVISGTVSCASEQRSVAADVSGGVHVVYYGWGPAGIYYSGSDDSGATFGEQGTMIGDCSYWFCGEPSVTADSSSKAYASWQMETAFINSTSYTAQVYRIGVEGTWGAISNIPGSDSLPISKGGPGGPGGGWGTIAATDDPNDTTVCASWGLYDVGTGVAVACTDDVGVNWELHTNITTDSTDRGSVGVDTNGIPSVTWHTGSEGIKFSRHQGGTNWTIPIIVDSSLRYSDPKMVIDGNGKAHIVSGDSQDKVLYYTKEY
jgi:hypothetical protein